MKEQERTSGHPSNPVNVNPGYALFQLAKSVMTAESHSDEATRTRAESKSKTWESILNAILSGSVDYGSRTPVHQAPAWATLEVVTGGFATGRLLAAGPLLEFERQTAERLGFEIRDDDRRLLNAWHLTEAGLSHLQEMLRTGHFEIDLPEEGALLTVAWLIGNGHDQYAQDLVEFIAPHFDRLRFYPKVSKTNAVSTMRIHVQNVSDTIAQLRKIAPNQGILAQKEAVNIWNPLYSRIVSLFLETVEEGWPCQVFPRDWPDRAKALLEEYAELRKSHQFCRKMERPKEHSAQLRKFLAQCVQDPNSLTGRDVARIRQILKCYCAKHGEPGSERFVDFRRKQAESVRKPLWHSITGIVIDRLERFPGHEGIEFEDMPLSSVTDLEARTPDVTADATVPEPIRRKVLRCLHAPVSELIERGIVTSAESLAICLPQMTADVRARSIPDPDLRTLYAAIDRAFRRRRSLLLLNLEKQVQIEELPWVAAIDQFRQVNPFTQNVARDTLEEITVMTLTNFPQAVIPNKLLQELKALANSAGTDIPLVEELAADIFMGEFSEKFVESAHIAAELLKDSLYATYFAIDYGHVLRIPKERNQPTRNFFWSTPDASPGKFAEYCISRAGVESASWSPAINGMIIEQQQILTTQNLAALVVKLDLIERLRGRFGAMARRCFEWILQQQRFEFTYWGSELRLIKNSAYAWRQMIFYLSLLTESEIDEFLKWTDERIAVQPPEVRHRFAPTLRGLALARQGVSIEIAPESLGEVHRFLGWTNGRHWLMRDRPERSKPSGENRPC